ncbi:hypothetical protein SETIT_5G051200v2 [Setaria italica]|uniref:Uncharacterized protein n=2 Tax=Setaria TaxID=4554 RepID=K3XUI2_SETIT|nr:uncharacterized protein LOC101771234 [Setaria italica]XP_034592636.1 uncharacterized protein LOC117854524 [Setaria viridis]RCV24019.1 hypothetical protein SETIT_5G051200v2 [Setaria italica]TKW12676.1 hypothetical protein SEVIR_5G050600v2 [Setaria viridis]
MASIVLLLSELLGGESASVLAADRYIMGARLSPREFRPAVTEASATKQNERPATGTGRAREERGKESFEDLASSRIEVDVMWP